MDSRRLNIIFVLAPFCSCLEVKSAWRGVDEVLKEWQLISFLKYSTQRLKYLLFNQLAACNKASESINTENQFSKRFLHTAIQKFEIFYIIWKKPPRLIKPKLFNLKYSENINMWKYYITVLYIKSYSSLYFLQLFTVFLQFQNKFSIFYFLF